MPIEKLCTVCGVVKPLTEFHRHAKTKSGRRSNCKVCVSKTDVKRRTPEYTWKISIKSRYGVTSEEYDEIFNAQNGVCAICRQPPKKRRLAVDHDHRTDKIRGILCDNCNRGLGFFKDTPALLSNAIMYLDSGEAAL